MGSDAVLDHVVACRRFRRRPLARCSRWCACLAVRRLPARQTDLAGLVGVARSRELTTRRRSCRSTSPACRSTRKGAAGAELINESQLAMIERQCRFRPPYLVQGPFGLRIWSGARSGQGQRPCLDHRRVGRQAADDDLDGRPAASVRIAPHTRPASPPAMGRQHAGGAHHAHEGGPDAPHWRAGQRSGDDDDAPGPPRRHPRGAGHHEDSCPVRTVHYGTASS